jgi:hypothetical protein
VRELELLRHDDVFESEEERKSRGMKRDREQRILKTRRYPVKRASVNVRCRSLLSAVDRRGLPCVLSIWCNSQKPTFPRSMVRTSAHIASTTYICCICRQYPYAPAAAACSKCGNICLRMTVVFSFTPQATCSAVTYAQPKPSRCAIGYALSNRQHGVLDSRRSSQRQDA